ncbi:MAG: 23S rRNA (pseudouridine(1915)-N(3))-methyltransferase RlmH [Clostridia bacterium]|nr:23S rRNA (pseudouridine(1915)-N(3))-methyltransferase RlmH [Clostridia bacterium]
MKVNLVCVGKVKEKYFLSGIEEYAKRLQRFCEFSVIETPEENAKNLSENATREREGQHILPKLRGAVFALAIEGKKYSSEQFAAKIKKLKDGGTGEITFVIGGSYGLSDDVKQKADELISFSDMTFPHTLFRLMFAEQIYRAFTIIEGVTYHK